MKTIAIIPALNEFERLQQVVDEVVNYVDFVVVVDDGSRLPLCDHLQPNERMNVLRHVINLGKGAALKTGVLWAKREGFEATVFIDADGQHAPHEIPLVLDPVLGGYADIAFGVRQFHGRMPLMARFGNFVLTMALNILFRVSVHDTQSGFRAMRLSAYDQLAWRSPRYAVETEMIVNAGKHHVPYAEVPISTIYHDRYKGTTALDGIRIMFNMITWRLS